MYQKIKKTFMDMKMFRKIFFSFAFISVILSLVIGMVSYVIASKVIIKKVVNQSGETILQLSDNFDAFFRLIDEKMEYLAYNPTVQNELMNGDGVDTEGGYYSSSRMTRRLMVQIYSSSTMEDIEIYGKNGHNYYLALEEGESKVRNAYGLQTLAKNEKGGMVMINDLNSSGCLQAVKQIKETLSMKNLGVLRIGIRLEALERLTHDADFASEGKIVLLDRNNQLILGDKDIVPADIKMLTDSWNGSFSYDAENGKYQIVYHKSEYNGWKCIGFIPMSVIQRELIPLQVGIVVSLAAVLILGLFVSLKLTSVIVRPVDRLVQALQKFSNGDFSVRMREDRKDEIGKMSEVFNETINRVNSLLEEISQTKMLGKELEFKALQAQINPHFLYNTLDTINWLARREGEEEICDMVTAVSNLMRISISNKETVFSIAKEINYVKDYLYIQKVRYRERLTAVFQVEDEILAQMIPKLTLQPLVENAIVYGIENSKKNCELRIMGQKRGEEVFLVVEDTGTGMPEEKIAEIMNGPRQKENVSIGRAHTSLGIYAVNQRLKYLFGEAYGLTITSQMGKGTRVLIRIPYQEKPEHIRFRADRLKEKEEKNGAEGTDFR